MRLFKRLLLFFLLSSSAFGALPAAMVWEVRVGNANGGASQNNGGGFLTGTSATPVDYSIIDANHFTSTAFKMTTAKNAIWNSSGTGFDTADVNNVLHITAGTGWLAGWYQVTAVDGNSTATLDRSLAAASTYTANSGTGCLGGAFLIGGTLDNDFFTAIVPGNIVHVAQGTYTSGENVSSAKAGTALLPITIVGYHDTRGDNPTLDDRPLITTANYQCGIGSYWLIHNIRFTTTYSSGIQMNGYDVFVNCKATNTSTSANYPAFNVANAIFVGCEAESRLGYGFSVSSGSLFSCYTHDSKTGIVCGTGMSINNCVVDTCQKGIDTVDTTRVSCTNNTIRGCLKGISGDGANANIFVNNIIADNVTGASWTTAQLINFWDYNCWSNNGTADVSGVSKGSHDVTADALLVSTTAKGTDGATGATGLVFTAATNPFAGVTTGDRLNITVTGTGATLGVYVVSSVDSTGQLTLATSAGASKTGITYCLVKGSDFTLGAASPAFNAGLKLSSDVGL